MAHHHPEDSGGFLAANMVMVWTLVLVLAVVILGAILFMAEPWANEGDAAGDGGIDVDIGGSDEGSTDGSGGDDTGGDGASDSSGATSFYYGEWPSIIELAA